MKILSQLIITFIITGVKSGKNSVEEEVSNQQLVEFKFLSHSTSEQEIISQLNKNQELIVNTQIQSATLKSALEEFFSQKLEDFSTFEIAEENS